MSAAPLLSFVVPTYNRARVVGEALRSVLDQGDDAPGVFEIVVVDDGSTDETPSVLAAFGSDARVTALRHQPNRGVAHARNRGIGEARGEWVALLDSDNRLLPGMLRELVAELRALAPSVVAYWGGSQDPDGRPTLTHRESGTFRGAERIGNLFGGEHFSVVRASVARAHPFPELGIRNECAECFWIPVFLEGSVHVTQRIFQHYDTIGDDRVCSAENRLRRATEMIRCFEEVLARFGDRLLQEAPERYWALRGKIALYECLSGERWRSLRQAAGLLAGVRFAPRNLGVAALCVAGPRVARLTFRYRAAATE
jgi:glycosyltransferase involved in cell wall biosynthesis